MAERIFPISGIDRVPLIGRNRLMERIWGELTKATPANLSIVGPKSIGKTVLLKALVARAKQQDSTYVLVIYWELGYAPPQTDKEFIEQLCDLLHDAMNADAAKYEEHRAELQKEKSLATLNEVLDLLQIDTPVLMIWDGFDKPLSQGFLSGQLFGNLRELFYNKRHRVITATRATQTELARNKQVEDSPFWNMFDVSPIRIGPLDDSDIDQALETGALKLTQGGRKELTNWTGGHPVILFSMLNSLTGINGEEITNAHVNAAVETVAAELTDYLDNLWRECNASTRNAFQLAIESDGLDKEQISKEDANFLLTRGLVIREGNKIKQACRLFAQHVRGNRPDTSTLNRMFGTWEAFRAEIRSILELRIKQILPVNARLHRLVGRALDDIPDHADDCLNNLTSIEEIALDTVWQYEFGSDAIVPKSIISYWTQPPRSADNIIQSMMDADDWRLPKDRFKQLALLQRLTGSKINFDSQAKYVSKDTYVLLNAIHQFRNRTEHADGQPIHEGVAVSALLLCIELLSCLERELGGETK